MNRYMQKLHDTIALDHTDEALVAKVIQCGDADELETLRAALQSRLKTESKEVAHGLSKIISDRDISVEARVFALETFAAARVAAFGPVVGSAVRLALRSDDEDLRFAAV